jgi:hypothetical protein
MLVTVVNGAKFLVSPISSNNPLTPKAPVAGLVPSISLTGEIYVGPPCSLDDLNGVTLSDKPVAKKEPDLANLIKKIRETTAAPAAGGKK